MLGRGETYNRIPYFFSDQYEVGMEYSGHASGRDRTVFRGDPDSREFIAFWLDGERVVAGMNVNVWDVSDPIQAPHRRPPASGPRATRRPRHPPHRARRGAAMSDPSPTPKTGRGLGWLIHGRPGHPLHPPLTDATIGMFTLAAALSIIGYAGGIPDAAGKGMWLALIGEPPTG